MDGSLWKANTEIGWYGDPPRTLPGLRICMQLPAADHEPWHFEVCTQAVQLPEKTSFAEMSHTLSWQECRRKSTMHMT